MSSAQNVNEIAIHEGQYIIYLKTKIIQIDCAIGVYSH